MHAPHMLNSATFRICIRESSTGPFAESTTPGAPINLRYHASRSQLLELLSLPANRSAYDAA